MSQQSASNFNVSAEHSAAIATNSDNKPNLEFLALPDVPLQGVISCIPLQTLITTVPLLHPRLRIFREIALRQNRHLILNVGNRETIARRKRTRINMLPFAGHLIDTTTEKPLYPESTDFHQLYLDTLEKSTIFQLVKLMPDISHLEIFIFTSDILHIPSLIHLLTLWSPTLLSLKLHAKFSNRNTTFQELSVIRYLLLRLIDCININLSSLVHLTLELQERLFEVDTVTVSLAMPILGQLREFHIYTQDRQQFIVDTLRTYATETLEEIGVVELAGSWKSFLEAFPGNHLASTFVHLPLEYAPTGDKATDEAHFLLEARFLRTFTNLREHSVDLHESRPLSAISALLAPLCKLTSLHLTVSFPKDLSLINVPIAPLTSVKILVIHLQETNTTHNDTVSPLWAHLFPSVQILVLFHSTMRFCTVCHPDAQWDRTPIRKENMDTVLPCIKQYLAPLTVLPSLRKMFYSHRYGDLLEFNPRADFVQAIDYFD